MLVLTCDYVFFFFHSLISFLNLFLHFCQGNLDMSFISPIMRQQRANGLISVPGSLQNGSNSVHMQQPASSAHFLSSSSSYSSTSQSNSFSKIAQQHPGNNCNFFVIFLFGRLSTHSFSVFCFCFLLPPTPPTPHAAAVITVGGGPLSNVGYANKTPALGGGTVQPKRAHMTKRERQRKSVIFDRSSFLSFVTFL